MIDSDKNLIESAFHILLDEIHGNAVDHGFWETAPDGRVLVDLRNKGEMIALMHSELSEMLEAIRASNKSKIRHTASNPPEIGSNGEFIAIDEHCPEFTSEEIEWADTLIRMFDYAKAFNLRAAEAVFAKHAFNKSRPHKHGKAF